MDYGLNRDEVEKIAGKKINMIRYQDLDDIGDIDELFYDNTKKISKPIDSCLIHFQTHHNNTTIRGHWCMLTKNKNNLYFFDSYGNEVDDQLEHIDPEYNKLIGQNFPFLSKLLHECPYNLYYNPYRLQSLENNSETCGRWCGLFSKHFKEFKDIDDYSKEFLKYKKKGFDLDELVVRLTDKYLPYYNL